MCLDLAIRVTIQASDKATSNPANSLKAFPLISKCCISPRIFQQAPCARRKHSPGSKTCLLLTQHHQTHPKAAGRGNEAAVSPITHHNTSSTEVSRVSPALPPLLSADRLITAAGPVRPSNKPSRYCHFHGTHLGTQRCPWGQTPAPLQITLLPQQESPTTLPAFPLGGQEGAPCRTPPAPPWDIAPAISPLPAIPL